MPLNIALAIVTMVLSATQAGAWWILGCGSPVVVERIDPIVSPGVLSGHVHTVLGGNAFASNMTYEDTQKSSCTTCVVTKDLSNYWVPSVFYRAENGSFVSVQQLGGANIYYQQRIDPRDPNVTTGIHAWPKGFRMVAGDPSLRSYNDSLEQRAVSFACIPASGSGGPATPGFPDHKCNGNLEIRVEFPMCWDGVNLDSDTHRSHMAYPSLLDNGICPDTHPKRMMNLFYETMWIVSEFDDMWYGDSQPFVLSNGDPTGYGFHGDFINGWDVDLLQDAIDHCTENSGDIGVCEVLKPYLQSADDQNNCRRSSDVDEPVSGVLPSLPGCNTIQVGPTNATPQICVAPSLPPSSDPPAQSTVSA